MPDYKFPSTSQLVLSVGSKEKLRQVEMTHTESDQQSRGKTEAMFIFPLCPTPGAYPYSTNGHGLFHHIFSNIIFPNVFLNQV